MAGKRRRAVGRDAARRRLSDGLRACTHCRPDAQLDIIDLSDGSIPHRSTHRPKDIADAPHSPATGQRARPVRQLERVGWTVQSVPTVGGVVTEPVRVRRPRDQEGQELQQERQPKAIGNVQAAVPALWPNLALWCEDGHIPSAYFDAAGAIAESIHADPDWRTWWSSAGGGELLIEFEFGDRHERTRISVRRGQVWASFRLEASRFKGRPPGVLAYLACTDMETAFTQVSAELAMVPPPALPLPSHATPPTPKSEAARERLAELRRRHRARP